MSESKEFELKYSHNVIEHLGLKLYQNRPTNVLAELVSNSWDADAENVWLDITREHLAVYDDGDGMTRLCS
ncbi:ATP-binding protein [Aeromonas salmonicida]|uniref:ATP-binding protein n=1 Tax=Aeromonas salmonicida TaxID=645 RepID=UPI003D21B983